MLPWHADAAHEPAPRGLRACELDPRCDASARMGGDPGAPPGPIPCQDVTRRRTAAPDLPQRRAVMTILVTFAEHAMPVLPDRPDGGGSPRHDRSRLFPEYSP